MSDDLISREALKDEIKKELDKADLSEYEACICVTSIYDRLIDNAPTVAIKDLEKMLAIKNLMDTYAVDSDEHILLENIQAILGGYENE